VVSGKSVGYSLYGRAMMRALITSERKIRIVFFILPPQLTAKRFWNKSYHSHGMGAREKGLVLNRKGD
jgi:hypothetical protein